MKSETNQPQGAPDARQSAPEPGPGLPSIIIDPSLGRDSERVPVTPAQPVVAAEPPSSAVQPPTDAALAAPDPSANIAPPPPGFGPPEGFESDEGGFNFDAAERFASTYRPSWEVAAPGSPAAVAFVESAASQQPAPRAAVAEDELPQLQLARSKRRATLLTVGAVAFFALMLVLALRSSAPELPAGAAATGATETTARAPAVPKPAAAAAPAQAPAPAPAPAPAQAQAPAQEPAPAPSEAVAAVPAPEPARVAAPPTIRVRVTTSPANAQLTLDGAPVANPLDATMPKGGKHTFAASAVGHRSASKTVTFDRHQKLTVELRPEVARSSAPATRQARPTTTRPAATRPAAPQSAPPPPVLTIEKQAPARKTKGAGFVADSPY